MFIHAAPDNSGAMPDDTSPSGPFRSESDQHACEFDPYDPDLAPHIHETLAAFRRECPIARSEQHGGFYLVTSHELVDEAGKDSDRFSSWVEALGAVTLIGTTATPAPLFEQDPPEHTHMRRRLQPFFTPRAAGRWEPYIRELARNRMAELHPLGACDFVEAISHYLPPMVTAAVLGIGEDQRAEFRTLARRFFTAGELPADEAACACARFHAFLRGEIRHRHEHPRDDLLTTIMTTRYGGRYPSEDELVRFGLIMSAAGNLTTADTISHILLRLEHDHVLRTQLINTPTLIPNVVEEMTRHESAAATTGRAVRKPTMLGNVALHPGDRLLLAWGSAARDETRFPDGHEFRINRGRIHHLGWGAGAHRCLGQHLARTQLRVIIEEILAAMPDYRLRAGVSPQTTYGTLRGVTSLPVQWSTNTP
jgi:cytochrome P450